MPDIDSSHTYSLFNLMSIDSTSESYALIEPSYFVGFWQFWNSFQPSAQHHWCFLFEGTDYQGMETIGPIVVRIYDGSPGETLYYWLMEQMAGAIHGVIVCHGPKSLLQVKDHWQNKLTYSLATGETGLLAVYLPTVLTDWWPMLSPAEQAGFMGDMLNIYLPSTEANVLVPLDKKDNSQAGQDAAPQIIFPYKLSTEQFQFLDRHSRYYTLSNALYFRLAANAFCHFEPEDIYRHFLAGIAIAATHYPKGTSFEHETLATYRFQYGRDFYQEQTFINLTKQHSLRESIRLYGESMPAQPLTEKEFYSPSWFM
jgi:hypothetical protein